MSISINWQPIAGAVILLAGVVFGVVQWWRNRHHAAQTAKPATPELDNAFQIDAKKQDGKLKKRRADDPAPAGAVDWVTDVCGAIDGAPAALILDVLKAGGSRESALIAERNSRKAAEPTA